MSGRFLIATASALLLADRCSCGRPLAPRTSRRSNRQARAGADVFGYDKVWQFHLTLTPEEYAAMQPAPGGFGSPVVASPARRCRRRSSRSPAR